MHRWFEAGARLKWFVVEPKPQTYSMMRLPKLCYSTITISVTMRFLDF